jgi:hypothetical protein
VSRVGRCKEGRRPGRDEGGKPNSKLVVDRMSAGSGSMRGIIEKEFCPNINVSIGNGCFEKTGIWDWHA